VQETTFSIIFPNSKMLTAAASQLMENRYTELRSTAPHLYDGGTLVEPYVGLKLSADRTIVTNYFKMLGLQTDKDLRIDPKNLKSGMSTLYVCGSQAYRKKRTEAGASQCSWQAQVKINSKNSVWTITKLVDDHPFGVCTESLFSMLKRD
jgi:hypothetical protein